ncbi:alcohol dehydrogenase [Candidatus Methylomirabilis lanthanidiphila]|uniref:alcohol dehydrogenase n=1 Tax=Candidatus Methylomirabilis lanthanidiphila TaxID=2211376 RepID=A0A564ZK87_9BACT|nr:zinc-dependent alcohol dehydrogenase family protein [Candidatus Methylomirabilis lanthanidiphila]VUZ85750.1 alcohol dehydrogenase [Candidatus Methylomirabilis lanthanidiphila]
MRALCLNGARPIEDQPLMPVELPAPVPGPGELRLRIEACGLCRTDLHIIEGDLPLPALPVVPGHQIVGVVDQVGEGVTRFQARDRLGVPWLYSTCGRCAFCRRDQENLCDAARFTGYHVNGGYAEFVVVREAFAYPLPSDISTIHAAPLLCAGVIGFRALRLSEIKPGERLGLYGFGGSAHIAIQVAVHWGCEVCVFTRSEAHRTLARQLGAHWAGRVEDAPPGPLDGAVIFAPAGRLVPEALRVLRKGGTIAAAGITMSPIPELDYALLYQERTVRSVANSTRQDVRDLLRLAVEIPIRTEVRTFPLQEANHALQLLKESRLSGAGVLTI